MEAHISHRANEPVQPLIRVPQQGVAGNDKFPMTIPNRAADQSRVGELRRDQCPTFSIEFKTEYGGGRNRTESLMLAYTKQRLG